MGTWPRRCPPDQAGVLIFQAHRSTCLSRGDRRDQPGEPAADHGYGILFIQQRHRLQRSCDITPRRGRSMSALWETPRRTGRGREVVPSERAAVSPGVLASQALPLWSWRQGRPHQARNGLTCCSRIVRRSSTDFASNERHCEERPQHRVLWVQSSFTPLRSLQDGQQRSSG